MTNPLPFPRESHFADEFSRGVEIGFAGDPHPKHPRGIWRAGSYVNKGRDHGQLKTQMYSYQVPDGSDPQFPTPAVGDRIYVGRWMADEVFVGGWGFASAFSGIGDLKAEYEDGSGTLQTVLFASAASMSPSSDFAKFEIQAVNVDNPTSSTLDLFFELTAAPVAGEELKGRLDFVGWN